MEKELRLQLNKDGKWEQSEPQELGHSLENNATSIIVELPSQVHGFTHFLEFVKPSGDVVSTLALAEDIAQDKYTITFIVSSELIDEEGRYAMQYVGRKNNKVVKSDIISLDIDPSVNAIISLPENSQDFVSWASEKIQYLLERVDGDEETDFVTLAEMNQALADKVDKVTGKGLSTEDYTTEEKNKVSGIESGAQVNVIEDVKVNNQSLHRNGKSVNIDLSGYETKEGAKAYAKSLEVSMDSNTYELSFILKDANGNTLSTQTVDLPSESAVVGGTYDNNNKRIVLLLQNGQTLYVPIADLISGLVSPSELAAAISTALADYYTSTQVDEKLDEVRAIATGKGKAWVLSYAETIASMKQRLYTGNVLVGRVFLYKYPELQLSNNLSKLEDITSAVINGDYDNVGLQNSLFQSQSFSFYIKDGIPAGDNAKYLIVRYGLYSSILVRINYTANARQFGDGEDILVVEQGVPDRWATSYGTMYASEGKTNLDSYYTKYQIDGKLSGLLPRYSISEMSEESVSEFISSLPNTNGSPIVVRVMDHGSVFDTFIGSFKGSNFAFQSLTSNTRYYGENVDFTNMTFGDILSSTYKEEIALASNVGAGGKLIDNDDEKEYKQYLEIEDGELFMTFEEITD